MRPLYPKIIIRRMLFKAIGIVNSVKAVCVSNMYRFYDFYLFFQYFSCYLPSTRILYNDHIQSINIVLTFNRSLYRNIRLSKNGIVLVY